MAGCAADHSLPLTLMADSSSPRLSIVVPVLNEAAALESLLAVLRPMQERGAQIVVVDGGSDDDSMIIAARFADEVLSTPRGRATQMNAGAGAARGDALLFLHGDSLPPSDADQLIIAGLAAGKHVWGRFNVRISGTHPLLRIVASMMNGRSRLSAIATGDQGIFMTRAAFDKVNGFPDIPLMEDIFISRMLKRLSRPLCLTENITTSGRRWEKHGVVKTILLMWRLRAAYFLGADPARLALRYFDSSK